jgi:7,8-dihydro-6-hydroxymethylpterin dimethyltransferase
MTENGAVWFEKHCAEHGVSRALVHSDAAVYAALSRFTRAALSALEFHSTSGSGCPNSCGVCASHEQHICVPIIEITDHCDLACPVCLVKNRASFHLTRADVAAILDRLIACEEQIDVLTLSGGEPTVNPFFREIVDECLSREAVTCVSVSTNGVRLARDRSLLEFLAERGVVISLQFDGFNECAYRVLRGEALLAQKLSLIDAATALDARMSLTAVVARGVNDDQPSAIADLAFERGNILSVMFQPAAYVGRAASMDAPHKRVTIPDVVAMLDGAARGRVRADDFAPLPCSHPACFALALYLKVDGGAYTSIKGLVDVERYLDIIQNRALFGVHEDAFEKARDAVYDLWSAPSGLTPDGSKALQAIKRLVETIGETGRFSASKALDVAQRSMKSLFVHQFMDLHTFDLARARKCCNVYPLRDGRMVPACVYNCLVR